jgi:hypothetical protein
LDVFNIPLQGWETGETQRELVKALFSAAETANRASALSFPLVDLIAHVGYLFFVVCHLRPVYSQGVGASSTKLSDLAAIVRLRRSVKQP